MLDWSAVVERIPLLLWVGTRIGAMLAIMPGFASRTLPPAVRLWAALLMAVLLLPVVGHQVTLPTSAVEWGLGVAHEAAVGLLLGLAVHVVYLAAQYGGRLAGSQIGFGFGGVIDPTIGEQQALLDSLQEWLALVLFFTLGAHRVVFEGLAHSFAIAPLGHTVISGRALEQVMALFGSALALGLQIAAPVIVCTTVSELAVGFMSRSVPAFNLFSVGFGIRIAVGLLAFALALPVSVLLFERALGTLPKALASLSRALAPAGW